MDYLMYDIWRETSSKLEEVMREYRALVAALLEAERELDPDGNEWDNARWRYRKHLGQPDR